MKEYHSHMAGLALVEVLVTLALLGFMLSALGQLQALARHHHALGRQQSVAILLAQARLAGLRQTLASGVATTAGMDSLGLEADIPLAGADTRYLRRWRPTPPAVRGEPWQLRVEVSWRDQRHQSRSVVLHSLARDVDPLATALLSTVPPPHIEPPARAGAP